MNAQLQEIAERLRALADEVAGTTLPEALWSSGDGEAILARQRAARKPIVIMDEAGLLLNAAVDAGAFGGVDGVLLRDQVKRTLDKGGRHAFLAAAAAIGHKRPPVVIVWEAAWIAAGIRLLADAIEAGECTEDASEDDSGEPLTARAKAVWQEIVNDGPLTGSQITERTGIDQSTLTSHIIPELKRLRGLENKRGAGYYSPKHYRPE